MNFSLMFFINSIALGAGLAMDAFSVSLVNGFGEPHMKLPKQLSVAGVFGTFQAIMPLAGWVCVHTVTKHLGALQKFLPWISLAFLGFIGGKMLFEGIKNKENSVGTSTLSAGTLIIQGIATSVDALSVGFTIAEYNILEASVCAILIAAVTFAICMAGLYIGRRFGTRFAGKANIFGGIILILIGIEIFIKGVIA